MSQLLWALKSTFVLEWLLRKPRFQIKFNMFRNGICILIKYLDSFIVYEVKIILNYNILDIDFWRATLV